MNFIDSHVHFWDQSSMPYSWLHEVPTIASAHTPETLTGEAGEDQPDKIVFVECGAPWLEEVKWVEALATKERRIAAIVAHVRMNAGAQTSADISKLRQHPLVRSVRQNFEHEALDFCIRPEFIAGINQLPPASLSFDLCCKHPQLPSVIELVRRCPGVSFILDHAGKPGIRAGLLDPWREHIRILATLPNVVCKFSGLVTEADHRTWTAADLRPYVAHLLETFGPARLLFGGDWPVAKLASGYVRWLTTAQDLVSHLSASQQAAIFRDNAARVYRI
jgi:L-fuconolactonase